ncbi:choice-of-anchor L domain-containing protein [Flavobacterium weaverense]|uniref:PKD domain-containing protein n=1 Tax=Flavobacterium weaverense TaxID=271156 RepID=A0A3M0AG50_9FLAO|nr:choice-of-anchor L domain-containing protein [Flavobacterium weaverense]RMA78222.1 hypothetical protein BC961_0601 [Flavobacterium weaverense]
MKFLLQILLFASLHLIPSFSSAQSILIDDNQTAQQLIEDVLVRSSCFAISNATVIGDSYTAGKNSYGYFSKQGGSFPFNEGIILSTWSAKNSENGPLAVNKALPGDSRWLGDTNLQVALGIIAPELTKNATVLEFDFIPKTNFISFNYLFAYNEYRDYFPCEFTDGFAFLIKEKTSTGPYINIAVLPNSSVSVSSKNVHPFVPPFNDIISGASKSGCAPSNENYFGGYNTSSSPINYYGQTKVLNAQTNVTAGVTYHIKLVIADYRNEEFDSAVFLEAGSFAPKINLGIDQTICFNENTVLDSGLTDSNYSYEWFKDGNTTPLSGEDKSTLKVTTAGIYSVEVTLAPNCIAKGKVTVNYKSKITKAITQCGDEFGSGIFDLTTIKSSLNLKSTDVVKFFSDLAETEITNPSNYSSTPKTVYAKVANSTGECLNFIEVELKVLSTLNALQTLSFCDNDGMQDGIRLFDLKNEIDPLIQVAVGINYLVEGYYSSSSDAATKQLKLVNSYTSNPNEIIYARVENGNDCYGIYPN